MSTELQRHRLNGATMGTRWSALFHAPCGFDVAPVQVALQQAVDTVDSQMSTWQPQSALMQLNRTPVGLWQDIPEELFKVISLGLAIGKVTVGAFDITMGDAVAAWGFGPDAVAQDRIKGAMTRPRIPAYDALELDIADRRIRKRADVSLDLNGIAKGFGVDQMADVLSGFGIEAALVGIDGELRSVGVQPDGSAFTVAVEAPEYDRRAVHSVLALENAAVATSGDYRHWVDVQNVRLSHTMDPRRGAPLRDAPASVTVVARTCAEADAWATALMVMGRQQGRAVARHQKLDALFLVRDDQGQVVAEGVGRLFGAIPAAQS